MNCITTASFSILLNGKPSGNILPKRGIRQGDPLSPYIFILCMEPLIRHLNVLALKSKTHVGLLSSPLGFRISNLMFADDCLIFGKASCSAARRISKVLDDFAKASGQKINFHKSSVYFSKKVTSNDRSSIYNILNIQHKATIGKYLGIHNIIFWKDPVNANELLLRISKKLAGWKSNTLSRAGKLTLIKTNLSGMPNHVMTCFKCTPKLTKNLDQENRRFFWGSDAKSPPIAWKEVCKPKTLGGLGVRPAKFFNNAALAKLAWKLVKDPDNWWVQIVRQKYLRDTNFFQARKKHSSSTAWKGILDSRDLLLKGLRWSVGNGKTIKFWTFNWVYPFPLANLLSEQERANLDWNISVYDFIQNNGWNLPKLSSVIDNDTVKKIMAIPLPIHDQEDELV